MKQETIAQEAYRLLKDISSKNFIVGTFTNNVDKCCVIGHYERLKSKNPNDYSWGNCCDNWNGNLRKISLDFSYNIAKANNGYSEKYKQRTPKERSLAYIKDMIKAGY